MNGLNSVMVSWPCPLLPFKLAKQKQSLLKIKKFRFYSAELKLNNNRNLVQL